MSATSHPHRFEGQHGEVKVTTRSDGIRRIRVRSWVDLAHALGWCVAIDRPRQLDVLRRTTQGRLAEVRGSSAVDSDVYHRRLGLGRLGRKVLEGLPTSQVELAAAFARGVKAVGPPSLRDWAPVDSVSVAQLFFEQLSSDGSELRMTEVLRRTLHPSVVEFLLCGADPGGVDASGQEVDRPWPELPFDQLRSLFESAPIATSGHRLVVRDTRPAGSNAWAVSDGRQTVLANDMHLPLTEPPIWYPFEAEVAGRAVAGATVPGLPFLVVGTHDRLAWGFTRLASDNADLVELPAELREVPGRPTLPGEYAERIETIHVLGAEPVQLTVRDTMYGPVVGTLAGRALAFRSSLLDPSALDFGCAGLGEAGSVEEGIDVVTHSGLPPVNVVLADAAGVVGVTVGGRHRRRSGAPRGFSSATATEPDRLAASELPRLVRRDGLVLNANNAPESTRDAGLGWNWFSSGRALRISGLLRSVETPGSVDSHALLQLDTDARFFCFYRDLAQRYLPDRGVFAELLSELRSWRMTAECDEVGLALLVAFREVLRESLFRALTVRARAYDPEFVYVHHGHEAVLRQLLSEGLAAGLHPPPWRDARHFVGAHLLMARDVLARRSGGPGPVRWGSVNRWSPDVAVGHPALVDGLAVELAGCMESVLVAAPDFGASIRITAAPGTRGGTISIPGMASERPIRETGHAVRRWARGETSPLFESGIS
ncbi:penicillin acylase family protein [Nocardioides zeae]|uniref:Penicillin amidase n=1 Tax=Nocardioides zeae TaxID=1457234 RepID=A0AAJ1U238_9ACTN|nr:penicillin acylase family protein [Nocardioides zeae]MDQ1102857.1 penicillin amidase [Nocardioides zeae]